MKRIVLFSYLLDALRPTLLPLIFPADLAGKVFAYMPSDGSLKGGRYQRFHEIWQELAEENGAEFVPIDNSLVDAEAEGEREKLRGANILMITGGNTCVLLRNLRRSGLDQEILALANKDQYVLAGFSAGAMIFTPTIQLSTFGPYEEDNKEVGLTDFTALNLVDYEVFPHYAEDTQETFEAYRKIATHPVKPLGDAEFLVIER
jgi:peptidase E